MAKVSLNNLYKNYESTAILHNLNLEIPDGSFIVLLGPSGCGKSTLLRMIAGLEPITGGEVMIGNRVVNDLHAKDRNIAMVFQNYALYAHMNVFNNMAFSLQLKRVPKDQIQQKVEHAAELLHLTAYLNRFPRELSGGQRQRVAMGRAIVRDPDVFLFDEPLSNLDAKLRVHMRTEIKALHQRLKTTTVYVTHDQIEAMTMADTVVVLRDGHLIQVGAPLEIYNHPSDLFVAGFVGSPAMNFINGVVAAEGGQAAIRLQDGCLLPVPKGASTTPGQKVVYGIRPEHLKIASSGEATPDANRFGINAQISVVEPTGPDTHVISTLGEQELCAITADHIALQPGAPVRLMPMPERAHLFDEKTGKAL